MKLTTILSCILGLGCAVVAPLKIAAQATDSTAILQPSVTPARDGIFEAFKTHPVVALGDSHGLTQEMDFYIDLIRDQRFAKEIGNVVVEFGDAAQQKTIDRYVNGEDVPYEQLRRVWSDTVGWGPAVSALSYPDFFAQVRAVNATLDPGKRIHVWLGDPPMDWSAVKTRADVTALSQRNRYPAELIQSQILSKNLKALVIYGTFHFYGKNSVKGLVEAVYPRAFFVVTPYSGFPNRNCSANLESNFKGWPTPALATPVRGTILEKELLSPGCKFREGAVVFFPPEVTDAQKAKMTSDWEEQSSGVTGDAFLYLGATASLTTSSLIPDFYLDTAFRNEMDRRARIMSGSPMHIEAPVTTSPSYVQPYGGCKPEGLR
jgi:hypothetical protein